MPEKIIQIIVCRSSVYNKIGGMENYAKKLINSLLKFNEYVVLIDADGLNKISVNTKNIKKCTYFNPYLSTLYASITALFFLLKNNENKLNFHFFGHTGLFPLIFSFKKNFTSNVYFLGYEFYLKYINSTSFFKKKSLEVFFCNFSHYRCDKIILLEYSQTMIFTKSHLENFKNKIIVINNFISFNNKIFKPNKIIENNVVFTSIGRNCPSKNRKKIIDDYCLIHKMLSKQNLKSSLIIVASGLSKALIKYINSKSNNSITLLNSVDEKQLLKIRSISNFEFSYSNQGVPVLSLLEAISYGSFPIVNNSHGNVFNKKNSILIGKNIDKLPIKIKSVFNNQNLIDCITDLLRKYSENNFNRKINTYFNK